MADSLRRRLERQASQGDGDAEDHLDCASPDIEITRTFVFKDFNESTEFVTRIAWQAEKADHHPDIDIRWNNVTMTLPTHSDRGRTAKDLDLSPTAYQLT